VRVVEFWVVQEEVMVFCVLVCVFEDRLAGLAWEGGNDGILTVTVRSDC
jgi:hypothetical protein